MYFKIALGNVRRSIRDYGVYFLTLTFGVCLFYVFNSIQAQSVMMALSETQAKMLVLLNNMMGIFSIFVCVVLGFLIVYANNFLIRRRKKELGLYLVLGMNKGTVARILMIETVMIGTLAFAAGLGLGILVSQALTVVTANLFMVQLKAFEFIISFNAIVKSAVFFGGMYLIVLIFNTWVVQRYKLIDLLQGDRRNEALKLRSIGLSAVLFLASLIILGCAYALILDNGFMMFDMEFAASIVLGSIGTFLFFFSLSGFLLKFVQSRQSFYYRNLNMFVMRQLNSRINSAFVSMTVISIMLLLTIGALCTGLSFNQVLAGDVEKTSPYDATLYVYDTPQLGSSLSQDIRDQGLDLDGFAAEAADLDLYDMALKVKDYCSAEVITLMQNSTSQNVGEMTIDFLPLSQLNAALSMQSRPEVTLGENEYLLTYSMNAAESDILKAVKEHRELTVDGKQLIVSQPALFLQLQNFSAFGNFLTIVLPDSYFVNKLPASQSLNLNYKVSVEEGDAMMDDLAKKYGQTTGLAYNTVTRAEMFEASGGMKLILSYIAVYLGLVFLIASAAILALQQLSESADNVQRYALLRKIGVEEKMIRRSLFIQIAIYFLFPLALAVVHSIVGVSAVIRSLVALAKIDIGSQVLLVGGFLALIYGGYFLITYTSSLSVIRDRVQSRRLE
ncbi:ABC transporter permease [Holdemania massiliensis]|uniref:FtsX-like permease family protein n=1 Tax=Holdemania massiliensis TaxID=1468449 RepID=A0A6N7S2T5_9FIRM|nr:ABC transporter permease [Holdemania massiliensis]MSA69745.1 FtsX-like permease family protein [Holdemania massiliensis]MSA87955.1 FtsX-like permease family protein [Holdemania massiliensis]MSB76825.1 FtsX-like permease family protein [Holdemania massiliensis]MSC31751.1 FtsX-like permease family protein [Holdemania massiliensis]MSC38071.1 FtsX-like permease family protein [Holdemania massiliensis]